MSEEGTQGREGAGARRRSFRLDRPQCPGCVGCGGAAPFYVKTPGNFLLLALNFVTVFTLGVTVCAMRVRCPGCGERFWFDPN